MLREVLVTREVANQLRDAGWLYIGIRNVTSDFVWAALDGNCLHDSLGDLNPTMFVSLTTIDSIPEFKLLFSLGNHEAISELLRSSTS